MHASKIIQDLFKRQCPKMHAKRRNCVAAHVEAARVGGLGLLKMSRQLCNKTALKQRIKCCDRLLSNPHLAEEKLTIYRALNDRIIPVSDGIGIIIDWSDLRRDGSKHLLRAAVIVEGRAFTVYEEVHAEKDLGSPTVHRQFLINLRDVLPAHCRPILVTDAGFRASWFKLATELQYKWIGRIRNRDLVRAHGGSWNGCKSLYAHATARPQDLGAYEYARSNPIPCRLVLLKKPPKGRKRRTAFGKVARSTTSKKNRTAQVEPWLLAASPGLDKLSAKAIVAIYAGRMQIEQTFRDLKNPQWGLGLSESQTRKQNRLAVLLLIGALLTYVLWIIGLAALKSGYRVSYGSNKTAPTTVSIISLARRWYDDGHHPPFTKRQLLDALETLASKVMKIKI